jgi:2-phospho-L-lactate guanylyltransferase
LIQNLTARVIVAAHPLDVAVVCDDEEVATWSSAQGARVIWTPTRGLNGAVRDGVDALAALGYETVIVAHGDLGSPSGLSQLSGDADLVLVPDVRHDGTNVLIISASTPFTFAYGAQSFTAHLEEAKRRGLSVNVITDSPLQHDVDEPGDLEGLDLETLLT